MRQKLLKPILIGCSVLMFGMVADITLHTQGFINDAQARVARIQPVPNYRPVPAAAAVRTTRRVIRRTNVYVATLPLSCVTVVIEGATLHQCGATYYRPYGGQYVVVVID
jgi:hypothetical protein